MPPNRGGRQVFSWVIAALIFALLILAFSSSMSGQKEIRWNDFKNLMTLYTTLLQSERRFALSQMYLAEPLAVASERLLENPDDQYSASEVTSLLKAI